MNDVFLRGSEFSTLLVTLVGTVVIVSAPSMLASWHHRSRKLNTGRERAQRFVVIWFLHRVFQLNVTRMGRGGGGGCGLGQR